MMNFDGNTSASSDDSGEKAFQAVLRIAPSTVEFSLREVHHSSTVRTERVFHLVGMPKLFVAALKKLFQSERESDLSKEMGSR